MVIKDKEMVKLVDEQRKYFMEDAPEEKRVDVHKRIVKLQNARKGRGDDR